jgi:hypothetical protein
MSETNSPTASVAHNVVALPSHLGWAIAIAIAFSVVLAGIEIVSEAKKPIRSCLVPQSFLYLILLGFGNVITTLLATIPVAKLDPSLASYNFLFASFLGVFAFQSILKNMNVTILDKGVLTIQDWMDKAKSAAAASAILKDVERTELDRGDLARKLADISEGKLNAFIAAKLPPTSIGGIVAKLDADAKANNADAKLYKAYALVVVISRNEIVGFLNQNRNQ